MPLKPIKLVLGYARRYTRILGITILAMMLLVGVQLLIPWIIKNLLGILNDDGASADTLRIISQLALLALVIFIIRAGLSFVKSYYSHIAGWGVVADTRKYIYERMQRFSLRFYENKQTGQLMTRVIDDIGQFEDLIAHAIPDVLVSFITLVGVLLVLFLLNWRLALLSLIPIPLVVLAMRGFARYVRPAFRERQKELGNINAILNDNLSGIRDIKAFTREAEESQHFNEGIERHRSLSLKAIKLMSAFDPLVEFASALGTLIVIYFGGRLAFNQVLTIPELVVFFLYLDMLYQSVRTMSVSWEHVQRALASADRVAELVEEEPEIHDQPDAIKLTKATGALQFQDVGFEYQAGQPVLEHIDLEIPARSVVALVGPSGVGKSTLVSLIPRFYDIKSGCITLDGCDTRNVTLESLRQQISIVLQDVLLFHGNVRENILFGNPHASDEQMEASARIANVHDFVSTMPDGYNTLIGERGIKLSGGQKQRISIARAILKDAPLLILDEATSSVDTETEFLIQQALERLMRGRTTIIIAHRLSTIRKADKIVVLDGHRIAESGTHDELMSRKGIYYKLNDIQNKLEKKAIGTE
ncbi:MAG: ABC transporter ATP-binding protein/permease [Dehalococcoidia bacterium]|nr:ABC transporter ATP-binding protein/permease [Dehalococcoidia bacterium]